MADHKRLDPIPESFDSLAEAADFWDTHSTADYDSQSQEVHLTVDLQRRTFLVPVEGSLATEITEVADRQGIGLETLVNLWLREKCTEAAGHRRVEPALP